MRENIKKLVPLYFIGCKDCTKCCDGSKFFLAPLILEDFDKVKNYFEIRAIILDEIIPVMLFNDGSNPCKYLKDGVCDIYENRPPACKIYPFSPYYEEIYIDLECDGIGVFGEKLPINKEQLFKSNFFEERFVDFSKKRKETIQYMKQQKLYFDKEIKNIKLYKFDIK
jgi:Fe-S-cluster containining protein